MIKLILLSALYLNAIDSGNDLSLKILTVKNNLTVVYEVSNNSKNEIAINIWNYGINGFITVAFYESNGNRIEMPCIKLRPDYPDIFQDKKLNVLLKSGEKRVFKIKMRGCNINGIFKSGTTYKAELGYSLYTLVDPIFDKQKYYHLDVYSQPHSFKYN